MIYWQICQEQFQEYLYYETNTYVAKPTIPIKPIKRTYIPTQSYISQDNRSEWQREQGSKKADEEYKKYMEDATRFGESKWIS